MTDSDGIIEDNDHIKGKEIRMSSVPYPTIISESEVHVVFISIFKSGLRLDYA